MTIISIMAIATFMAIVFLLFRYGAYHLFAWLKPLRHLKLTYVDTSGTQHSMAIDLENPDVKMLIDTLNEIQKTHKNQGAE
ncbi:hypothetical protein QVH39_06995 [Enterobacter pseudoroggenkampii]|uniref:hypothetical protein n=1 Tax=Enterobacter pseudoroggenkampii TaxID=2996112 RepID=UPI0025AEE28F|nr:hypothetical protein [Enterobacter pseudoroggenkampii]WJW87348.1 hypothetical protein QVH39_06995 [Enterobacter pseudoroggenkampii]